MNNYELIELFPVLVYKKTLKQIPKLKNLLENAEFRRYEKDKCWLTDNKILEKYPELSEIILKELNNYVENVLMLKISNINFYISRSWLVKHKNGDYGKPHAHTNSLISGVLYLNVDDRSGDIVFEKTNCNLFPCFEFEPKNWNKFNCESWSVKPSNGDLLFFPSHLKHSILENKSNIDRCVLAFDFFFRGKIGNHLHELSI